MTPLEQARREAEEACPCRQDMNRCSPPKAEKPMCRCFHDANCAAGPSPSEECPDADGWMGCDWPGHAAIRRLELAARLEQAEAAYKDIVALGPPSGGEAGDDPSCCDDVVLHIEAIFRQERDRIRREMEEANAKAKLRRGN